MRFRYLLVWLPVALSVVSHTAQSQNRKDLYFPQPDRWERKDPVSLGMDPVLLKEAIDFALGNESTASRDLKEAHYQSSFAREPFGFPIGPLKARGAPSGLVVKNGYIVAEWGTPERVDLTFSVAKSFLSTIAGLAVEEHLIKDVNDKVYPYMAPVIPYNPFNGAVNKADEIKYPDIVQPFETEHNRKITWDHLLRQTSDWEGTLWGKPDWADRPEGNSNEWSTRARNEPGSVYKYNDVRVNVLALALLNVWRKPLPAILKEKIMDPIGASGTWRWTGYENSWVVIDGYPAQSVSGGSHWGGGLFINAYDQARFGYLTLRNGRWKDRQLIPERWMDSSRTPTSVRRTYGYMNYFLNTEKELYPSAPETAFAHIGAGTNMVYVDVENDLVIVARWIDNDALDGLIGKVIRSINK